MATTKISRTVRVDFACGTTLIAEEKGLRISEGIENYGLITWETVKKIKTAYDMAVANLKTLDNWLLITVNGYDDDCMDLWFSNKGIYNSEGYPWMNEKKPDITYDEMKNILDEVMPLIPKPVVKKPVVKKTAAKKK